MSAVNLTFAQYLPLARLGASLLWHKVPELVVELLHFVPALSLRQLVTNAQFRCAAVRLSTTWRASILVTKVTNLLMLQLVMVVC
jgi:hypothetical protein